MSGTTTDESAKSARGWTAIVIITSLTLLVAAVLPSSSMILGAPPAHNSNLFCTDHWCGERCCSGCNRSARPLLFAHVEKTGGSALECAALPLVSQGLWINMGHTTHRRLRQCVERCHARDVVLSVRSPYSYYLSMYRYAQRPPEESLCAEVLDRTGKRRAALADLRSFISWVQRDGRTFSLSARLHRTCGSCDAASGVGTVLHTETLEAGWRALRRRHHITNFPSMELQHINNSTGSKHQHLLRTADEVREAYGDQCELLAAVTAMESSVFDRFGYERVRCTNYSSRAPPAVTQTVDMRRTPLQRIARPPKTASVMTVLRADKPQQTQELEPHSALRQIRQTQQARRPEQSERPQQAGRPNMADSRRLSQVPPSPSGRQPIAATPSARPDSGSAFS